MRSLKVDVDNPFMDKLTKGTKENYRMFSGIVVITFQDAAEGCPGCTMQQITIHRSLESFNLPLVPGHQYLRELNIDAELSTGALKVIPAGYRPRRAPAIRSNPKCF